MAVKYVFVTGGVVSGLGKGITAAFTIFLALHLYVMYFDSTNNF